MVGLAAFLFMMVVLILVISALWPILAGHTPWEPMPLKRVHQMLALAEVQPDELVYDLGCGDGRMLVIAAKHFKARAVGIEIDPIRYVWSQLLITVLGLRSQVRVIRGSFHDQDLSEADIVAGFLIEQTNRRLQEKLSRELRPGARVVCYEFPYPDWTATKHDRESKLFLYRQPEKFDESGSMVEERTA